MAKKRSGLAFPDNADPRGRRAILRSRDEIAADEEALESRSSGDPESQNSGSSSSAEEPGSGKPDRTTYQKVTYRVSPEAVDAVYEAQRMLRRTHKIKATLEEIAELALIATYEDLANREEASTLVCRLSGIPESQDSG